LDSASPAALAEATMLSPPSRPAEEETRSDQKPARPAIGTVSYLGPGHEPELLSFLAPAQRPDELGRLGPYRVFKVLGTGGMGVVFQAEDPQLERPVALKTMLPALAASAGAKQRFLREARAAAAVKHDYVVTIYQVGEDRGVPFLAMELLKGETLQERLRREGRLPVGEVLRLGREIAEGLAAAHERGLIHRDIKASNVWLESARPRVKILDFGLARAVTDDAQLTQQGVVVGTPGNMAPEQAKGEPVDARCDLFSLGCVLYHMSTGQLPFRAGDAIAALLAVATESPRPPGDLNPTLPAALCSLIMQLLAKSPDERPASAVATVHALEAIEREELTAVDALPAAEPVSRVPKAGPLLPTKAGRGSRTRSRLGCAGAVFLSLLLVCGGLAGGMYWVARDMPARLASWWKGTLEEQRAWEEVSRFWRPPPADAGPERLFPAQVETFTWDQTDTPLSLAELDLPSARHHAVYRSQSEQMDVFVYQASLQVKQDLFQRALEKIHPQQDPDDLSRPPRKLRGGQPQYHTVVGTAEGPRISYTVGPPKRRGILWWDRGWLFVVRTEGERNPEEFLKDYLVALSNPQPER
jgi:hypothetical protein